MSEILMLVDENDRFLGYATREECHEGNGKMHRAFVILLFNKDKKMLLQKRKSHIWNKYWDITAASHTLHTKDRDETYAQAAARCLKREWGISADLKELGAFTYFEKFDKKCENEFCMLLAGEHNGELKPNESDVHEYRWASLKEIAKEVRDSPENYTPWARLAIEKFTKSPESKKFL